MFNLGAFKRVKFVLAIPPTYSKKRTVELGYELPRVLCVNDSVTYEGVKYRVTAVEFDCDNFEINVFLYPIY